VGLQASKTYQELSQKAYLKSETDVIELVTKSYYTVLLAYANEKIFLKTKEDIQKTYDEIKKTYEVGMADETDVSQIELNLITIENSISSISRQIMVAENILKFQIGIEVKSSISISDSIENIFENASLNGVMDQSFDINKNIDYQMLMTQKDISALSLKREKSTFLPTLSGFYTHQVNGPSNDFGNYFNGDQKYFQSNIIGAGLSWNIFSSGSKYVKVQQAQLELDKVKNQEYILEQSLEFQVHQSKSELINAYETYLKEQKNTLLSEKIYRRSLVKFTNGLISSNELTQLNIQYFNSQSAYYSAMISVLNAKADLDKILGNNL
jgi:outer membrane protein TolC